MLCYLNSFSFEGFGPSVRTCAAAYEFSMLSVQFHWGSSKDGKGGHPFKEQQLQLSNSYE